jgi:ABC-type transport system substrate-binding protein
VEFTDTIPLPRVKEVEQGGKIVVYGIPAGVSPSSYFMLTRSDKPPLDNSKVRQAISLAFDRKALLEVTFDVGTIKSNLVPPKHWAFNPSALSYDTRDLARAKQLMAEAGQAGGFSSCWPGAAPR